MASPEEFQNQSIPEQKVVPRRNLDENVDARRQEAENTSRAARAGLSEGLLYTSINGVENQKSFEKKEQKEAPKYKKVDYLDPTTGYKVTLHIPEGKKFSPLTDKVSFYFPGDGSTNKDLEGKGLLEKMPEGYYAVVSGGEKSGANKYARLSKKNSYKTMLEGAAKELGVKPEEIWESEAIGFSRGGGALNRLLSSGEVLPGKIVLLDTCREPIHNVIKYVKNGGKVDFHYADDRSFGNFQALKSAFDLKPTTDGSFQSADGKLKVYPRIKKQHRQVAASYFGAEGETRMPKRKSEKTYQEYAKKPETEKYAKTPEQTEIIDSNSEVNRALSKLLIDAAKGKGLEKHRAKGHCEQYSNVLRAQAGKLIGGKDFSFKFGGNFNAPILSEATRELRAKRVDKLKNSDLTKLPPGTVFFVNTPGKYGNKIVPGTDNILPKIADKRHWFTYMGQSESGEPILSDNWGDSVSLKAMQRLCGNRVVLNVYDPYAEIRDQLAVTKQGQLVLNRTASPQDTQVASL